MDWEHGGIREEMTGKKVMLFVVCVLVMLSELYAEENQSGACVVKDLGDILIFKDPDDPRDGRLTVAAREYVSYFRESRRENISKLVSLFHIESPDALLEWGGGLGREYHVVLFSDGKIYRTSWHGNSIVFAKINPDEVTRREISKKLKKLSGWSGEAVKYSTDRIVLFMTFYENGIPRKAFYSDFPDDVPQKEEPGKTCFNEWRDLLRILENGSRAAIHPR